MTTGAFWNVEDPLKPWGLFDPDDVILISFDFSEYLVGEGSTYVDHNLSSDENLEATTIAPNAGVILVQVQKAVAGVLEASTKYGITCQVVGSDGQKLSKTLWLKIKEL
jgi:hypothetical protein